MKKKKKKLKQKDKLITIWMKDAKRKASLQDDAQPKNMLTLALIFASFFQFFVSIE